MKNEQELTCEQTVNADVVCAHKHKGLRRITIAEQTGGVIGYESDYNEYYCKECGHVFFRQLIHGSTHYYFTEWGSKLRKNFRLPVRTKHDVDVLKLDVARTHSKDMTMDTLKAKGKF